MPLYEFYDTTTKKKTKEFMTWDESVSYLEQNPHVKRMVASPRIVRGVGSPKSSNAFKDRLREMKKKHRGNTINV